MPPVPGQLRAYPFTCKLCGRSRSIVTPTVPRRERVPEGWTRDHEGKPVCGSCAWIATLAIALLP